MNSLKIITWCQLMINLHRHSIAHNCPYPKIENRMTLKSEKIK